MDAGSGYGGVEPEVDVGGGVDTDGSADTDDIAPDAVPMDEVPLERLEEELVSLAPHLAAAEARWLEWLAAYDRREGWRIWECRSAAHWLNWKCGMSLVAARERVRVARALEHLPLTRKEFAQGALSYSKARAITRAAPIGLETDLLSMARSSTAAQLDRICSGIVRAGRQSKSADDAGPANGGPGDDDLGDGDSPITRGPDTNKPDTDLDSDRSPAWTKLFVSSHPNDDGTSILMACLTDDTMALLVGAIDAKVSEIINDGSSEEGLSRSELIDHRGGLPALRAQALTEIITDGDAETTVMMTVPIDCVPIPHIDPESSAEADRDTDSDVESRSPLGSERWSVVERLACDCRVNLTLADDAGRPLSVGRDSRTVPKRIRTALELRDHGMCQFPGCATTRGLHAHHVVHWLRGGLTELDNLVLVCSFHHHVIHDGGTGSPGRWTVQAHEGGFLFRTPAGEPATVEDSRGSLIDLYWFTRQRVGEFTRLEPIDGGRITDLSWITTAAIHNARNQHQ
ncbi:MAG: DUF222 domain-containing protein [Actinomycetia bacterium]|nr:DUF222 domain-containing protein [Actinomycetes bacterium]